MCNCVKAACILGCHVCPFRTQRRWKHPERQGFGLSATAADMTNLDVKISMLCRLSRAGSLSKPPAANGGSPPGPAAAASSPPLAVNTQRTASLEVGLSTVSISGGAIPPPSQGPGSLTPATSAQQPGGVNLVMTAMAAANAAHAAANGGAAPGAAPQEPPHESAASPTVSAAVPPAQPGAATLSRAASLLDEPQEPLASGTDSAAEAGSPAGGQQAQQQDGAAPQDPSDQPASPAARLTGDQPAAAQADPAAAPSGPVVAPGLDQAASGGIAQPGAEQAGNAQQPVANGVAPGSQAAAALTISQGSPPTAGGAQAAPAAGVGPLPSARAAPPPLPPLEKGDMLEAFRCCTSPCIRRYHAPGLDVQPRCRLLHYVGNEVVVRTCPTIHGQASRLREPTGVSAAYMLV